jgi:hypothetical protein
MPHQLVLCKDETFCSGDYVLVSLYNYTSYISAAQQLLLYDWGNDNNIHSYSQGKYI